MAYIFVQFEEIYQAFKSAFTVKNKADFLNSVRVS